VKTTKTGKYTWRMVSKKAVFQDFYQMARKDEKNRKLLESIF
jgi:hypothetical protein